jgi:hypothetical protein
MTPAAELPALPEAPAYVHEGELDACHRLAKRSVGIGQFTGNIKSFPNYEPLYTAAQMHAYALSALAAARGQEGEDSKRLDWIEANEADTFRTSSSNEFCVQIDGGMRQWFAPTLRAALAAAMKEKDHAK